MCKQKRSLVCKQTAHAGTDLDLNKASPEFFSDSVKKNSQHVQTKTFIGVYTNSTCRDRPRLKKNDLHPKKVTVLKVTGVELVTLLYF